MESPDIFVKSSSVGTGRECRYRNSTPRCDQAINASDPPNRPYGLSTFPLSITTPIGDRSKSSSRVSRTISPLGPLKSINPRSPFSRISLFGSFRPTPQAVYADNLKSSFNEVSVIDKNNSSEPLSWIPSCALHWIICLAVLCLTVCASHAIVLHKLHVHFLPNYPNFAFGGNLPLQTNNRFESVLNSTAPEEPVINNYDTILSAINSVNEEEEFYDPLGKARSIIITPLRPIDQEQYTVRINTWRRNELLLASIDHHSRCDGVAQVQVLWNDPDNPPPEEIVNHKSGLVIIEDHTSRNSLNERFRVLTEDTPTLGILNIDDDVLYPCEAIDTGFFLWKNFPKRIVGYDKRSHAINPSTGEWIYGKLNDVSKSNKYSLTLTRYCFIHVDYLSIYTQYLPRGIFNVVHHQKNCEDIAMSLLVSALTDGQAPLLADNWALTSIIKLHVDRKISGDSNHLIMRGACVHSFARILELHPDQRTPLQLLPVPASTADAVFRKDFNTTDNNLLLTKREKKLRRSLAHWNSENIDIERKELMRKAMEFALPLGLVVESFENSLRVGKKIKVKHLKHVIRNKLQIPCGICEQEIQVAKKLYKSDRRRFLLKYSSLSKKWQKEIMLQEKDHIAFFE